MQTTLILIIKLIFIIVGLLYVTTITTGNYYKGLISKTIGWIFAIFWCGSSIIM